MHLSSAFLGLWGGYLCTVFSSGGNIIRWILDMLLHVAAFATGAVAGKADSKTM